MKEFINPIPDGGFPIYDAEINSVLQSEIYEVLEGLGRTFSEPIAGVIMSGGEITDLGATFNIAAGICYLDGKIRKFASASGLTSPAYINPAADVTIQTEYADAVVRDYTVDYTAIVEQTSGAQFITLNLANTTPTYLKSWLNVGEEQINEDRADERRSRPVFIGRVNSGGLLTTNYSTGGTWSINYVSTGKYQILRGGAVVPNLPTQVTPVVFDSSDTPLYCVYQQITGTVLTFNSSGTLVNAGFNIVSYPEA